MRAARAAVIAPIQTMAVRGPGRGCHEVGDPGQHEDPGRHHGCGVDQCRDRGGALHRIGQPDVKGNLGGFPNRSAEDQDHREIEEEHRWSRPRPNP